MSRRPAPAAAGLNAAPRPWPSLWLGAGGAVSLGSGAMVIALSGQLVAEGLALMALVFAPLGAAIAAFGGLMLWYLARLWTLPRPVIRVGPEGLTDRRLSEAPLPWRGLRWQRVVSTGRGAGDAVLVQTDAPLSPDIPQRLLAALYRARGRPPWAVLTLGTGVTTGELAAALTRYRPAGR